MSEQLATRQTPQEAIVEFMPFGSDEKIKLTVAIVMSLCATPTRTGKLPSKEEAMKFMMLCRARHLNPFEGDAYLVGYDSQDGPKFSLLTAHQVFLKRAEANDQFEGMQSGVIVERDGQLVENEGDFTRKGETLLGGWAKVLRKDRKVPFLRRLKLETFDSDRSRWKIDKAGMIVKCAEADALRSAFPTHLGGLYAPEEGEVINIAATVIPRASLPDIPKDQPAAQPAETPAAPAEQKPEPPKKKEPKEKATQPAKQEPPAPSASPADGLLAKLEADGLTAEDGVAFARAFWPALGHITTLAEIPAARIADLTDDWAETMKEIRKLK